MTKQQDCSSGISIGRTEQIPFVGVAGRTENAVNLDSHIRPMETFWRALEIHCVSECCGIDAHSFHQGDIWNGVRTCGVPDLKSRLAELLHYVKRLDADCLFSQVLNQYFDREVFRTLLEHVIATVNLMGCRNANG